LYLSIRYAIDSFDDDADLTPMTHLSPSYSSRPTFLNGSASCLPSHQLYKSAFKQKPYIAVSSKLLAVFDDAALVLTNSRWGNSRGGYALPRDPAYTFHEKGLASNHASI